MSGNPVPFVDDQGSLHLPPQIIPPPRSLSPEAQEFLLMPRLEGSATTEPKDRAAWVEYIAAVEQAMEPRIQLMLDGTADACSLEEIEIAGVTVHVATPHNIPADRQDWVRITVHGGAFVLLGGRYAAAEAAQAAVQSQCVVYGIDYRQPPDFPYPTPVDDVVAVYQHLAETHDPRKIAVSGGSAGSTLIAAAVLKARDQGLPLPAAVVLSTPLVDLTKSGDSWNTNLHLDNVLSGNIDETLDVYTGDANRHDPYVSPLFGDFSRGFPPTLLMSGTRDLLLSDTVLMHRALRKASIPAELHIWDAGPHGNYMFGPEREDQDREELEFLVKHLS